MKIGVLERTTPVYESYGQVEYYESKESETRRESAKTAESLLATAGLCLALSARNDFNSDKRSTGLLKIGVGRILQHASERFLNKGQPNRVASAIGEASSIVSAVTLGRNGMLPPCVTTLSVLSDTEALLLDGMEFNRQVVEIDSKDRQRIGKRRSAALVGSAIATECKLPLSNLSSIAAGVFLAAQSASALREEENQLANTSSVATESFPRCLK